MVQLGYIVKPEEYGFDDNVDLCRAFREIVEGLEELKFPAGPVDMSYTVRFLIEKVGLTNEFCEGLMIGNEILSEIFGGFPGLVDIDVKSLVLMTEGVGKLDNWKYHKRKARVKRETTGWEALRKRGRESERKVVFVDTPALPVNDKETTLRIQLASSISPQP